MKKLLKPIAFLFAIALTTGAYAQEVKPQKNLQVKERAASELKICPRQKVEKKDKPKVVNGFLRSQSVNEQGRQRYKVVAE